MGWDITVWNRVTIILEGTATCTSRARCEDGQQRPSSSKPSTKQHAVISQMTTTFP